MKNPLITIVTVCYNVAHELPATMESVINQTYDNIEYIIIDGGSSDNSVEVIKKHEKIALEKGIVFKWISEKDKGIYDAMNKGIALAAGEWINFMNAGDYFYDKKVLELFNKVATTETDIVYGDATIKYDNANFRKKQIGEFKSFFKGIPFCHQSVFTKAKLMKEYKFDLKYWIAADFDFFYKMYKLKNIVFKFIPIMVSVYDANGISAQNVNAIIENKVIVNSYGAGHQFHYVIRPFIFRIKRFFKIMLPESIVRKIQMRKSE